MEKLASYQFVQPVIEEPEEPRSTDPGLRPSLQVDLDLDKEIDEQLGVVEDDCHAEVVEPDFERF